MNCIVVDIHLSVIPVVRYDRYDLIEPYLKMRLNVLKKRIDVLIMPIVVVIGSMRGLIKMVNLDV